MTQVESDSSSLGLDWDNDDLFFTYAYQDETSQFDDHPSVRFCGDYYSRSYKCRIPRAFKGCHELIEWFIDKMIDYPDERGFWRD